MKVGEFYTQEIPESALKAEAELGPSNLTHAVRFSDGGVDTGFIRTDTQVRSDLVVLALQHLKASLGRNGQAAMRDVLRFATIDPEIAQDALFVVHQSLK